MCNKIVSSIALFVLTWVVWSKIHRWFGMIAVVPGTIDSLFQGFFFQFFQNRKHALKVVVMIWHAVIWVPGGSSTLGLRTTSQVSQTPHFNSKS
jgi:hypothetical protein